MTLVRLGIPHLWVALDLAPPVLPAGLRIGLEFLKLDGAHLLPDTLRPTKIGDAAFGADARPAEGHQIAAGAYQSGEFLDLCFKIRVHSDITIPECPLRVNRRSRCDAPLEAFQDSPPYLDSPQEPSRRLLSDAGSE